jgi:hypothetical protein
MPAPTKLPIAVIGGGPIGLAAAAHLVRRGFPVKLYEAGSGVATNVRDWGQVRLFSPWRYNVDAAAKAILLGNGWREPDPDHLPTGAELHADYLKPLSETPAMKAVIETNAGVIALTRQGIDKVGSKDRESRPFVLSVRTATGLRRDLAQAVIDASGTWNQPNPLGADGTDAQGERALADRIAYGLPDVLDRSRDDYAGKTTLVVGAGYSAADVLLDLAKLRDDHPRTTILWVTRSINLSRVYGGGASDQLPARGELGESLRHLVQNGPVTLTPGFAATAVQEVEGRLIVEGETAEGPQSIGPVDRIVVSTGQRPDLSMTRELRLELDPWLESTKALGPLIDPNLHSCGSVPPHGHRELSHPEPGFYTIGIKSYGRAPTFLLLTGYEQARSVAAAVTGDLLAADSVQLILPETGVCVSMPERELAGPSGCCGGPAPAMVDACCVADAAAKDRGKVGCGCKAAA